MANIAHGAKAGQCIKSKAWDYAVIIYLVNQ